MADADERPRKTPKVDQNHEVKITHIDHITMDHYCSIKIHPDRMFPTGTTKTGVRIAYHEFSKGCKVLGERCFYRLLTPLSSHAYGAYLNKATQDFMRNRDVDGGNKPVIQVQNQSPFRFRNRSFVCASSSGNLEVFELFPEKNNQGFAAKVELVDLPFILNWSSADIKPMSVDDVKLQHSLVKIISALDALQPKIEGLGVCVLAEFGRFLIYNLVVDGEREEDEEEDSDNDNEEDCFLQGYKQMILILQSGTVETGKSFLCEVLARMFHGKKHGICSTISFDSARKLLGNGEPVIIDDFSNDEIGSVLVSRVSKATWGQSAITIRGFSTTPKANLLLCTNEVIKDIRVEGKSKTEVHQKFSVIDLGESPLSESTCDNKSEMFKIILHQAKVIRQVLPSFFGLSLQMCGSYITSEQYKEYNEVTTYSRLANILKNAANLYEKLRIFCEQEHIEKPRSLKNKLDTSCLLTKSELSIKYLSPDQVVEFLIANGVQVILTVHNNMEGIAFDYRPLTVHLWFDETFKSKRNGVKIFCHMRTRQLNLDKSSSSETQAAFVSFQHLKPAVCLKVKEYIVIKDLDDSLSDDEITDPKLLLVEQYELEYDNFVKKKVERFDLSEKFVLTLSKVSVKKSKFSCNYCNFIGKNKGGLTNHLKKCKDRSDKV